jgi:prepilin-type N-terminal cleavage/methylation domain-containing protein
MSPKKPTRRIQFGFSLIELLIVISIIGIMAAIAVPKLINYLKTGRETAAVESLRSIHNSQTLYASTKGGFGTLKALAERGMIDKTYASGKAINHYIYTDSDVAADAYCVHADRMSDGSAYKDFNITEDGIVHFIESPAKGTVPRGQGTPISGGEGAEEQAEPAKK